LLMTREKAREHSHGLMGESMLENGKMESSMVKALT
jgi:hypothetical protein